MAKGAWKALVHVLPARADHPLSRGSGGAYVTVLGLAYDETSLREAIASEMDGLGLVAVEMNEVEPFDPTAWEWKDEELQELTENLTAEWPVQYRTFHCYPLEDTDG